MAPLDWKAFMKLKLEDLEEDQGKADDIYDMLSEYDAGEETDVKRWKKLFTVTQGLMLIKGTQAQVAEEELSEAAADNGKTMAQKDQELEDLRRDIANLEREKREWKRFGGEGDVASARDTRFLRDELSELEHQMTLLSKEIKDKDRQLHEEKQTSDRYIGRAEDAERELRDVRRDNDQMREDIRDLQRQLDAQRETMVARRDDDTDVRDKIRKKNTLLNDALNENRSLVENNLDLENKLEDIKKELKDGRLEMEKTMDEYLKLKNIVNQTDSAQEKLRRENDMLKDQMENLMQQVKSRADQDDNIMVQLNTKVEEWKVLLAEKDARIAQLQQQVVELRGVISAQDMDSEKTSVVALTKALEERDKKVDSLKKRLEEAVGDMEANAMLIDDVRGELGKTSRGDRQQQKIGQLQGTLRVHEGHLKDAETRATQAEEDARKKDKELNEALDRISKLEAGEYGLPEAVAEIKEHKMQVTIRDRQIEELTQYINQCEIKINELYDESEDLRDRLGLDPKEPLDMSMYKKKKGVRMQEDRALNRILQKEIERLEEERTELKLTIRRLAKATGQRAVSLGLTADDVVAVDSFIDDLKEKNKVPDAARQIRSHAEAEELKMRKKQAEKEVEKTETKLQRVSQENAELKAKNKELENENKNMEKGMREIHEAIKEQGGGGGGGESIQCPSLDRMLAAIDAKSLTGRYDTTLYLKAQCDNLTGHNEELRKELRETRYEATKARVETERANGKVEGLEAEVKTLKEVGAGGYFQTMPLPQGMAVTSADVINSLNEHLIHAIQEVHLKEDMIGKMETSLENYRRKFAVMRHQQGLLYQDYIKDKDTWESSEKKLSEELREVQGLREEEQVRLQEFDRLVDSLSQEEPEVRRRLADMTRKITVLRVNEKALARRYGALAEAESALRKDCAKMNSDMIGMETAVAERLGYLQRYKDMAQFQIAALQKNLDDSVPGYEMERMTKQFTELTEKYRDMLEKSNNLVARSEETSGFEIEMKRLQQENIVLSKELGIEKEKLHTLEAAFENMKRQGMASSQQLQDSDVISISKKLTTLEMKELNERQRAEHAHNMYEQQKITLRTLEDRNFELEAKFAELTRNTLDQQRTERELRDELANCVTREVSDNDRKKITVLEKTEHEYKMENSKLKEISEVASMQVRSYEQQQTSRDKEVISLRQQLVDFQAQSDEKTVIGKLHRHIVQLQVSEGVALRKLEDANSKISKMQALQLRTEQRMDDKDQTIYHNRLEARSKTRHLKHTILDLRRKYAGAVPMPQQEKFAKQLINLQNDKQKMEDELKQTNMERLSVEQRLAELRLQHDGLQDLIATLKDGRGAEKVVEWHKKMEAVRLEDLRLKRDIDRLKQQMKFSDGLMRRHEAEVLTLEEEKVRQAREFEERELDWERREVDLERIIANMERAQAEIAGAASEFDQAVGALPDSSWPVPKQLEAAVQTIKTNVKTILDAKAEVAHYKTRMEEMSVELRDREKEVVQRDKLITEMRLRMPADAHRDEIIMKAQAASTTGSRPRDGDTLQDYEGQQAVKVAQSTVSSLQARIVQKEETIKKYQELLQQARDDAKEQNRRHEEELRVIQDKLHNKNDAAFRKFKQHINETLKAPASATIPTNDQLRKLNELDDIVADQDNSIAALRDKLSRARQEVTDWKCRHDDVVRAHEDDKHGLMSDQNALVTELEGRVFTLEQQVEEKESYLQHTQDELERQKEANARAPTSSMKKMIERLKNELALKENQQKALSKALTELRADMVTQAQEEVKVHAEQNASEFNVQKIVDKQTKEYQERIEELDAQNSKLKKLMKRAKDEKEGAHGELEEVRQDLSRRENQLRKHKEDKARKEQDIEELEKKVDRMSTMAKQRGVTEPVVQELEDLKAKNKRLQEELRRVKHQPEKPYVDQVPHPPPSARDPSATEQNVAKWEESKKWQQMTDRLKGRIKEKDNQLDKLSKANELMKNGLERATKDKDHLEGKLRTALRQGLEKPIVAQQAATFTAAMPPGQHHAGPQMHNMQELKKKNHELEEEIGRLKRQYSVGRDKAMEDVNMRNKFLAERLEELEGQLGRRAMSASQEGSATTAAFRNLADKEQSLQKKILQLSDENIELRFEVEATKKDIPRLKERIADQQKYIEILKNEKEQLKDLSSARSHSSLGSLGSLGSISSNIRRIGESGKTTKELEKTIALLKKVVERTQAENQQLKKAPGPISGEKLLALQEENVGLKSQLEELRQKMGATLSERYVSQQKGTAKVMADHEKLRRDLLKEVDQNEKLRIQARQQESQIRQLQQALEEERNRAVEAVADVKRNSKDAKDWKALMSARAAEEKATVLETELDKKTQIMEDVKVLLREAAEREQHLLKENEGLTQKANVLEKFPPGSKNITDKELLAQYQLARLTTERLENEKKELVHELQMLRKKVNPSAGMPGDVPTDEIVEKIANYDRMMRDNVDLSTQLKSQKLAKEKLQTEVNRLTKELANFGPDFFDEIEDLKYNYREAVQRNVVYEEQLRQLSDQFGVAIDIPPKS